MSEINPNHPVTAAVREHWNKVCAALMHKLELNEVHITQQDIETMPDDMAIVVISRRDELVVKLLPMAEAMVLAREHGGLPS